jgi:hypothetical protein
MYGATLSEPGTTTCSRKFTRRYGITTINSSPRVVRQEYAKESPNGRRRLALEVVIIRNANNANARAAQSGVYGASGIDDV